MTPRSSNLLLVRQACEKAQGKEAFLEPCHHKLMHDENGCPFGEDSHLRPTRLADVLLAIKEKRKDAIWQIDFDGLFMERPIANNWECRDYVGKNWNLHKSLEEQSDKTLQFLADLLSTSPTV